MQVDTMGQFRKGVAPHHYLSTARVLDHDDPSKVLMYKGMPDHEGADVYCFIKVIPEADESPPTWHSDFRWTGSDDMPHDGATQVIVAMAAKEIKGGRREKFIAGKPDTTRMGTRELLTIVRQMLGQFYMGNVLNKHFSGNEDQEKKRKQMGTSAQKTYFRTRGRLAGTDVNSVDPCTTDWTWFTAEQCMEKLKQVHDACQSAVVVADDSDGAGAAAGAGAGTAAVGRQESPLDNLENKSLDCDPRGQLRFFEMIRNIPGFETACIHYKHVIITTRELTKNGRETAKKLRGQMGVSVMGPEEVFQLWTRHFQEELKRQNIRLYGWSDKPLEELYALESRDVPTRNPQESGSPAAAGGGGGS